MRYYSPFRGAIPLPWSGRIRVTHPCAGRRQGKQASLPLPRDLHVLGLSLAFILSQDQTLRPKISSKISYFDSRSSTFPVLFGIDFARTYFRLVLFCLLYLHPFNVLFPRAPKLLPVIAAASLSKADAKVLHSRAPSKFFDAFFRTFFRKSRQDAVYQPPEPTKKCPHPCSPGTRSD
jgi:hypothetical protein